MNKYLVLIIIVFSLILISNNLKKRTQENMETVKTCDYSNSLNYNRGQKDINKKSKELCYFKPIYDSKLEINTLKPVLGKKLDKKQLPIDNEKNKFFNYENLQVVKPSYESDDVDNNKIFRPKFNPDATISRIPYDLHKDLFVRYYLSKINKINYKDINNRVKKLFSHILKSNVFKINKLILDDEEKDELRVVYSFNNQFEADKKEMKLDIIDKLKKIIDTFNIDNSISQFIDKLNSGGLNLIITFQNNAYKKIIEDNKIEDSIFDNVIFYISKKHRITSYLARCINNSKPSGKFNKVKLNESEEKERKCSLLSINQDLFEDDTRQILHKEINSIYQNVYGLNQIPNLNISFDNGKVKSKQMSGDLIRTTFEQITPTAKNISKVQTALSYYGLCDNIMKNNESRNKEYTRLINILKKLVKIPDNKKDKFYKSNKNEKNKMIVEFSEFKINEIKSNIKLLEKKINKEDLDNETKIKNNKQRIDIIDELLKKDDDDLNKDNLLSEKNRRKQLIEYIEKLDKLEMSDDKEAKKINKEIKILEEILNLEKKELAKLEKIKKEINEILINLKNNDYNRYYIALAVSDKIKNFSEKEITYRNNSKFANQNAKYKTDMSKVDRYSKLDYFPEADLVEINDKDNKCLSDDDNKPVLSSIFKCLIKKYTSIGISNDPYLAMDIAIKNCEPEAGILFLDKNRYFGIPNINKSVIKKCTQYKSDNKFNNICNQTDNCNIVKIVETNNDNKCKVHINQKEKNKSIEELVKDTYKECQEKNKLSNQQVQDKCSNKFNNKFLVDLKSKTKFNISNKNINNYLRNMLINQVNSGESKKAFLNENSIMISKIEDNLDKNKNSVGQIFHFTSDSDITLDKKISYVLKLNLTEIEEKDREEQIEKCYFSNKFTCKVHSVNDNFKDLNYQDYNGDKIPNLIGSTRRECDKLYQKKFKNYKCLTDCYKINNKVYHNKMKATGLGIKTNITSSISGNTNNFVNKEYDCQNIKIEEHTWEGPSQNFSNQSELILDQFQKNGRVNIVNKFRNKCLQDSVESAMNNCKQKFDNNLDCYYYKIDGKDYKGDQKLPNNLSNSLKDSLKSTTKTLQNQCDRDTRQNQPELCNETVVIGLDKNANKAYAFQSSNKCYLDYINGSKYDYLKVNNVN